MKPRLQDFPELKRQQRKIAALTAYDYPVARLLDASEIDIILVGDSLGMVVLGYPDTTLVTVAEMLHHCRAVARGATRTFLVGDLPAGSYVTPTQAVETARQFIDSGMHAVKLEGGRSQAPQIRAIVECGIPVMAHIGMLPQNVRVEGGYHIKGSSPTEADALLEDAAAVEGAGAFAVVLEIVVASVAACITRHIGIPTIGIGSGNECDGQILVSHDLIGLFPWFTPRFVTPRADVAGSISQAVKDFVESTRNPSPAAVR